MVWDESKHPRDDIGRFTFSNGGYSNNDSEDDAIVLRGRAEKTQDKRTPSDILYGGTSKKEKSEEEYRNVLLNVLKNTITPAMVLYATIKELEQAVKNNGLTNKLNEAKNAITQKGLELAIGKNYNSRMHNLAKFAAGKDGAGMLDLSHGINMNDRSYIKDTISLDNYNDPKVASDKKFLKEKISQQFKDYNFDINKIKGYYFKSNSKPSQRLAENKDFQDMIKNHKKEIIEQGGFKAEFKKIWF